MKNTELRLGNFVKDRGNKVIRIDFLEHVQEGYDTKFGQLIFLEGNEVHPMTEYSDHAKPIQLTEEWFKKFVGFQYSDGNYWVNLITHYLDLMPSKELWYPTYVQIPEFSSEEEQRVNLNAIQYVHQLQNLYFALTGVELQLSST